MIIQALMEYYDLCGKDIPLGWSEEKIRWIIVVDTNGMLVGLKDTEEPSTGKEKKREVKTFRVPTPKRRTSGIKANLLWEKDPSYLFCSKKSSSNTDTPKVALFKSRLKSLKCTDGTIHPAVQAVLTFLEHDPLEKLREQYPEMTQELMKTPYSAITFQLREDEQILLERPDIRELCDHVIRDDETLRGRCAFSGQIEDLITLHDSVCGRVSFLTFQEGKGYFSYGKEKGFNAPMSWETMKKYTAAIKYLLQSENNHINLMDDEVLLFWATREDQEMEAVRSVIRPTEDVEKVKSVHQAPRAGVLPSLDSRNFFYLLGIYRHQASKDRYSIRTWVKLPLEDVSRNVSDYFNAMQLFDPDHEVTPSLPLILRATFPFHKKKEDEKKKENLRLGQLNTEILNSALQGKRFPVSFLTTLTMRLRTDHPPDSDQKKDVTFFHTLTQIRIALLKAYLIRNANLPPERKPTPMLDPKNPDVAYNLGRLFSVFEYTQECALRSEKHTLNTTIKDRYFSSASMTPSKIFPMLQRNINFYEQKLRANKWKRTIRSIEEQTLEITDHLPLSVPATLSLTEQAQFFVGYYHQRSAFRHADKVNFEKRETEQGEDELAIEW